MATILTGNYFVEGNDPAGYYKSLGIAYPRVLSFSELYTLTSYLHDTSFAKTSQFWEYGGTKSAAATANAMKARELYIKDYLETKGVPLVPTLRKPDPGTTIVGAALPYFYNYEPGQILPGLKNPLEYIIPLSKLLGVGDTAPYEWMDADFRFQFFHKINFVPIADYFNTFSNDDLTVSDYIALLILAPCAGISFVSDAPATSYKYYQDTRYRGLKVPDPLTSEGGPPDVPYDTSHYLGYIGRTDVYTLPDGRTIKQAYDDAINAFAIVCFKKALAEANDLQYASIYAWDSTLLRNKLNGVAWKIAGIDVDSSPVLPPFMQTLAERTEVITVMPLSGSVYALYEDEWKAWDFKEMPSRIHLKLPDYYIDGVPMAQKLQQIYNMAMLCVRAATLKLAATYAKTLDPSYQPNAEEIAAIQDFRRNPFFAANIDSSMFEHTEENLIKDFPIVAPPIAILPTDFPYYVKGQTYYQEYSPHYIRPPKTEPEGSIVPLVLAAAAAAVLYARGQ